MASASYDAQVRIRRDAEEHSIAHQDLGSWMDQMKSKPLQPKPITEKKKEDGGRANSPKVPLKGSVPVPCIAGASSCEEERIQGNSYFAQGEYEDAIKCYTRCLGKKDALTSPLVYSNRAVAYLKTKSWPQAESDASSALQIDPLHFKSYQRRCVARLSLGKVRASMGDICAAEDSCMLAMKEDGREGNTSSVAKASLIEIHKLRSKVERALVNATERAPRRKVPITIIAA